MPLNVEVIPGDALGEIAGAWDALAADDPLATPFQSADWAAAWLAHWDLRGEAWIVAVREGDALRGIVPVTIARRGGVRVLGMLGKEPGDYWDVVATDADRPAVAAAAGAELLRRGGAWDIALLNCLPPGSPALDGLAGAGLRIRHRPPVRSPHVPLPATFDEYLAALPRKHRSNLRKHLARLDGGDVACRCVTEPHEIREAIDRWRDLRSRQWQAQGKEINPLHEREYFAAFMADVALRLIPQGRATLWEFGHDGAVAGVYLNFHDERAFYWYLGGFDPALSSLGLGKIAVGLGIRESIAAGRASFDFTRGSEPYKYWYGAVDRELSSALLGHGGVRSRTAFAVAAAMLAARERRAAR